MRIIATVTNDLNYDQRMQRICTSLVHAGHEVTLVGRVLHDSVDVLERPYRQERLRCIFNKGPLFYLEYNLRLFFLMLFRDFDAVNIVDLDTMLAGVLIAKLRQKKAVFDAHEHFTEVPEVTGRPRVKAIWHQIGKWGIPKCDVAYTVGPELAKLLSVTYGKSFATIRNVPIRRDYDTLRAIPLPIETSGLPFVFYQGALNTGRGLPEIIGAMQMVEGALLLIAGEGDLSADLRTLTKQLGLESKVIFLGKLMPEQLAHYTAHAYIGVNLLENRGLSYYYSLANKFFDYINAEVPGISMDFPEYRAIVAKHQSAILLPEADLNPKGISRVITDLLKTEKAHRTLRQACKHASEEYVWEIEEEVLLSAWSIVYMA
jgi:glycosyltransferase involved in cell wall biosynthesis